MSTVLLLLSLASTPGGARSGDQPPLAELPPVRVQLTSLGTPHRLTVRAGGGLRAFNAATGESLDLPEGAAAMLLSAAGDAVQIGERSLRTLRLEAESLTVETGRLARTYPGALVVTAAGRKLRLLNECSLESYTEGVLAGECPALFHPEALKAMAVAVRSYSYRKALLANSGKGELCDTHHCQVYRGSGGIPARLREAVRATAGLCALYEGEVIDAVYCSDCGGYTEANEEAWKGAAPLPYLRPVEDAPEPHGEPYCAVNRFHTWKLPLSCARLQSLYGKPVPALKLEVLEVSESGRVRSLRLAPAAAAREAGEAGEETSSKSAPRLFSGEEWRRQLGLSTLKSLRFEVRETAGGVELEGQGYGHGVGLCQFGAHGMARQGLPFDVILKHYYTGVELAPALVHPGYNGTRSWSFPKQAGARPEGGCKPLWRRSPPGLSSPASSRGPG